MSLRCKWERFGFGLAAVALLAWLPAALAAQTGDRAAPGPAAAAEAATSTAAAAAASSTAALAPDPLAPVQGNPGNAFVLEGAALRGFPAHSVADLLRQAAGIEVRNHSGLLAAGWGVSVHGSDAGEVLVFLDGRRLNDAVTGAADLSTIGLDQVERIEIRTGGASARYGDGATAGVVYISTKHAKDGLRIFAENTSYVPSYNILNIILGGGIDLSPLYSVQTTGLSGAFKIGATRFNLSGGFDRDSGQFGYLNGGAQAYNSQITSLGGRLGLGIQTELPRQGQLFVRLDGLTRRQAYPGTIANPLNDSYIDNTGVGGGVGLALPALADGLSLNGQAWGSWSKLSAPSGKQASYGQFGLDLSQEARLSELYSLGYGGALRVDSLDSNLGAPVPANTLTRVVGGFFAKPALKTGGLYMAPTVRMDFISEQAPQGSVNLDTKLDFGPSVGLELTLDRSYRLPSLVDPYYSTLSGVETSYAADLGLNIRLQGFTSRSAGFFRYAQNSVNRYSLPFSGLIVNFPGTVDNQFWGFDQDFGFDFTWLQAAVGYEFNRSNWLGGAYTLANDYWVPLVPLHKLKARLAFKLGGLEIGADGVLAGAGFFDYGNTKVMPAYFLLNAHLTFWMGEVSQLYVNVDNIFNQSYQLESGYPLPGISLRIGLVMGL